jgi:glycerol-3-phosphate acyltransferase PlsY
MTTAPALLLALIGGYLAGSIPFGVIITRLAGLCDIRAVGSGNIGATNVLRTGRKGLAFATLLLDGAKGAIVVLIAQRFSADAALAAAIGAVFGHVFPVWLKFKGGKGVATAIGVYLALAYLMGIAAILTWIVTAGISRRSSVGGIVSMLAGPVVAAVVLKDNTLTIATALIAILVVARHADNIRRLIAGTEPKIGGSKT